jgi:trimethylamine:corrinoid methyltransferase-like protein
MLGGAGPVTMAGALVQHNAEVLEGLILAQLARPGSPFVYGCVSAPMDLRNAEISQGNFETALLNAAVVQIADRYRSAHADLAGQYIRSSAQRTRAFRNRSGALHGRCSGWEYHYYRPVGLHAHDQL